MRTLVAGLLLAAVAAGPAVAQAPAPAAAKPQAPAQAAPPATDKAPAAKPVPAKVPEYDPAAETKIQGVVEDFHQGLAKADHPGLHLMVRTDTELVEVHTCPLRFMKDLEFTIEKGDTITVTGSRPGGTGIVLAREITKGQISLIVRDKTGAPVWTR
ncbi:MAG TPA: hypothetical protein VMX54_12115 [Vicinamibacteria bacterium]|nr:hypothetical protein [Vicinamibacteria bacterium]